MDKQDFYKFVRIGLRDHFQDNILEKVSDIELDYCLGQSLLIINSVPPVTSLSYENCVEEENFKQLLLNFTIVKVFNLYIIDLVANGMDVKIGEDVLVNPKEDYMAWAEVLENQSKEMLINLKKSKKVVGSRTFSTTDGNNVYRKISRGGGANSPNMWGNLAYRKANHGRSY